MALGQRQPPCAKEPPGTAELGQTPLPDLDSLLLLLIQIRAPRYENSLASFQGVLLQDWALLAGGEGGGTQSSPAQDLLTATSAQPQQIRKELPAAAAPLTQLERHEEHPTPWAFHPSFHSWSPSPLWSLTLATPICPSAPSESLRLGLAEATDKF